MEFVETTYEEALELDGGNSFLNFLFVDGQSAFNAMTIQPHTEGFLIRGSSPVCMIINTRSISNYIRNPTPDKFVQLIITCSDITVCSVQEEKVTRESSDLIGMLQDVVDTQKQLDANTQQPVIIHNLTIASDTQSPGMVSWMGLNEPLQMPLIPTTTYTIDLQCSWEDAEWISRILENN